MSFTYSIIGATLGDFIVEDTAADATGDNNVLSASANLTVRSIEIDNTLGSVAVYFKLYDNASPTIGTTAADDVLFCPAGKKITEVYTEPLDLNTALSYACTQGASTSDSTSPAANVPIVIVADS